MSGSTGGAWEHQRTTMGAFIRSQREMANMSLRQLAQATQVSNAYLSQIERGLHDPTVRVLVQIGQALHLSIEDMLTKGAPRNPAPTDVPPDVETAVRTDTRLSTAEREALLAVYRSYVASHDTLPPDLGSPGATLELSTQEPPESPDPDATTVPPKTPRRPSGRRRSMSTAAPEGTP